MSQEFLTASLDIITPPKTTTTTTTTTTKPSKDEYTLLYDVNKIKYTLKPQK